eukprot:jgi/Ulvmu1/10233/UM060_0034.1
MDQCPAPADGLSTLLGSIDIGDIDLDPALQLDGTGDEFVEWLESFQDDVPLPVDDAFAQTRNAGSTESSHVPSMSSQAGSGSLGDDKSARRQGRSGATTAQKVDRLEKVREKNRLAQARFRQKKRQELESVQSQVQAAKEKLADATARCRAARGLRNTLSNRVTAANSELVGVLQGHSQLPAAPPTVPEPAPQAPVTDAAPMASAAPGALTACDAGSLLPHSAARSFYFSRERPLSSYLHSAKLSPDECDRQGCMIPGADGCINLRDSIQAYKNTIAKHASVPSDDICWFLQAPYVLHTGQHMSFSSSLSSNLCCSSFFIFFMASSLENTLASAELDCFNGALEDGEAGLMRDPLTFCPSNAPLEVGPAIGNVVCRKRTRGAPGEAFSSSLMLHPLLDPATQPKLIRCGVNEATDVTAAVSTIIGGLLREARSNMPRAQWLKCCHLFLRFVDQVAGRGDDAEQGLPEYIEQTLPESAGVGGGTGMPVDAKSFGTQVGIMLQALCNVTASVMHEDVPEVAWAACEARRQQLLQRVEHVGMAWGMSWYCLMTDAKRMVRYLVTETVGPQRISFDRTELVHIRVYKEMKFTMEQRRFMSDFWGQWERRRRALDGELASALERLDRLPSAADLDGSLLMLISAAASGSRATAALAQSAAAPQDLLGLSPGASHASMTALEGLVELHYRDARQMEDFVAAFALPSWFLSGVQRIKFCCGHVKYLGLPVDLLVLCQMAANQERREALFSRRPATADIRGGSL